MIIDDGFVLPYKGGIPWVRERTILLANHGSHAYGLSTPTSDFDYKGIAIPPKEHFLGFANRFEQIEHKDPDMVIYDIRKFFALAADCNPSIIEVLWSDTSDYHLLTAEGAAIIELREHFISKKARHTFSGYAMSQLKRINIHYRWLKNPPKAPPTRAEYDLPERTVISKDQIAAAQAAIHKKLETWNLEDMSGLDPATRIAIQNSMAEKLAEIGITADVNYKAAARAVGIDDNFILLLDKERQYCAKKADWDSYQNWLATRNPKRAELEAKFGYDTKHAMHLVRLMRMCREILETGKVNVKRKDREELLDIRAGAWTYEELVEWARKEDESMNEVYKASTLRHSPDRDFLDKACVRIVESMNG